ncbi:MAG TPA: hypothetical protein GXX37_13605 [Clostridiaceae bacterium]|nr:hypothetical protein [Clostridiaceae bacterium]
MSSSSISTLTPDELELHTVQVEDAFMDLNSITLFARKKYSIDCFVAFK